MKKILLIGLLASLLLLGSCAANPSQEGASEGQTPRYQKISAEEAKRMMDSQASFVLLDVRSVEEFRDLHIVGAVLIPDFELQERAASELPDKDMLIFVYCRSGGRSARSTNLLVDMGYTNVYDIGGINSWPYETTSG